MAPKKTIAFDAYPNSAAIRRKHVFASVPLKGADLA
jgi:hypothetical protein